ncbi:MAG: hypothetical protein ABIX19_12815 [Gemmatimonadaceae bacterium]
MRKRLRVGDENRRLDSGIPVSAWFGCRWSILLKNQLADFSALRGVSQAPFMRLSFSNVPAALLHEVLSLLYQRFSCDDATTSGWR